MENTKEHGARTESNTALPQGTESVAHSSLDPSSTSTGAEPATSNESSFKEDGTEGEPLAEVDASQRRRMTVMGVGEWSSVGLESEHIDGEDNEHLPEMQQRSNEDGVASRCKRARSDFDYHDGGAPQSPDDETRARKKHVCNRKDDEDNGTVDQAQDDEVAGKGADAVVDKND